jgi:hypothetical protein
MRLLLAHPEYGRDDHNENQGHGCEGVKMTVALVGALKVLGILLVHE